MNTCIGLMTKWLTLTVAINRVSFSFILLMLPLRDVIVMKVALFSLGADIELAYISFTSFHLLIVCLYPMKLDVFNAFISKCRFLLISVRFDGSVVYMHEITYVSYPWDCNRPSNCSVCYRVLSDWTESLTKV